MSRSTVEKQQKPDEVGVDSRLTKDGANLTIDFRNDRGWTIDSDETINTHG